MLAHDAVHGGTACPVEPALSNLPNLSNLSNLETEPRHHEHDIDTNQAGVKMPPNHDVRIQFVTFLEKKGSRGYPLGILSISAFLKASGYKNVAYMEFDLFSRVKGKKLLRCKDALPFTRGVEDERITWLAAHPPAVLFIGPVFTYNLRYFVEFSRSMKQMFPGIVIFGGGPHFGKMLDSDRELLARNPHVSGLVIGDGEETAVGLLDAISGILPANAASGLSDDGAIASLAGSIPGVLMARNAYSMRTPFDIEHTSLLPDYQLLETNPFSFGYTLTRRKNPLSSRKGHFFYEKGRQMMPFAYINGSRGCLYPCIFCAGASNVGDPRDARDPRDPRDPRVSKRGAKVSRRVRTPEDILSEIREVHRARGTTLFFFTDPLFLAPTKSDIDRVDALFTSISRESRASGVPYRFILELRIDVVNRISDALLAKMMRAGVREINLGFEKATNSSLRIYGKHFTTDDQKAAIAKIRRVAKLVGVHVLVVGTFVLGGPSEGYLETFKTFVYPVKLGLDTFRLFPLEIFPGTAIEHYLARSGKISPCLDTFYERVLGFLRRLGDIVAVINYFIRSILGARVPRPELNRRITT